MSLIDPARQDARVVAPPAAHGTVVLSLAAHVVVLAALVVVPLLGQVTLPGPVDARRMEAFVHATIVPAVPSPPAPAVTPPAATPSSIAPAASATGSAASVPLEAPDTLPVGEPPAYVPGTRLSGALPSSALVGMGGGRPGLPSAPAPPPRPGESDGPLRVGGDLQAPRKLHHVAPEYPRIAAQAQISGTVVLEATIAATGKVVDVRVLRSVPLLDGAAIDAVRQWRYAPPRLNGTPVAVLLTVTVRFGR